MSDFILELRGLRKVYGHVVAVDEIWLSLAKGEFLTLLGPSGSGKTTTLLMVAGLASPTEGEMMLDGKPLNPLPPYKRSIGMVFQNYSLFPHMKVAKNVAFPLEMRGESKREIKRKVADVLRLVGLPDYGDRYPGQLSGGQQQRIALARAMVFEPRLLLMDEPLGALDKKLREQMQIEIMRLHKKTGMSVIYVTHDQEEALVMSDRVAVFNHGRIVQSGPPEDLYENPNSQFVAGFLGESNFLPGTVTGVEDQFCRLDGAVSPLRARRDATLKQGDPAVVVVRPEHVQLIEPQESQRDAENCLRGIVSEVIYLGRSRKYVIRLEGAEEIRSLQQLQADGVRTFSVGDAVAMKWNAQRALALPGRDAQDGP